MFRTFPPSVPSKGVRKKRPVGEYTIEHTVRGSPGSEGEDVALAVGGDQQAFERLYRRHHGRVYSLALRMAGVEWAEDLTQEVFIRSWKKLAGFRGEASFGTWLHRLAVNLILSRRETLRRRSQKQLPDASVLERIPTKQGQLGFAVDFEGALQRLPDRAKQVFLLYDVEGYPHEEIARAMGISTGTSKSQLHRARLMMREFLK